MIVLYTTKNLVKMEGKMAMTDLLVEIKKSLENRDGKWNEKKGLWDFSATIAERKAFLSKKKLTYSLRLRIDDGVKVVKFSEMLAEAGSGLSSGGDFDSGMSSGFGFKTESYNTFGGKAPGNDQRAISSFW